MPDVGRPGSLSHRLVASTRILAVEDETDIADFLRAYFRASGYDLVHVDPSSVAEVIDAIDQHAPDLVLLDYGLRGFSGHEAYRVMRADPTYAFLPVIVVTADVTAEEKSHETASGIDGFMFKPFNVNTLANIVAERIEAARALEAAGHDDTFGIMSWRYLRARLNDEVAAPPDGHPVTLALIQLRSTDAVRAVAGDNAVTHVLHRLIDVARDRLPVHAVLGRTDTDELAVIVSGVDVDRAVEMLATVVDGMPSRLALPGGTDVQVGLAIGVAAHPEHATGADELYMAADAALAAALDGDAALQVAL